MNTIREIAKINELELERGIAGTPASWHQQYLRSAWVYVGNLDSSLTEGDILCVMSQYGEIDDINLVRDESSGKSKGFCFLKYEDARSCVLAVDNLGGIDVCGRSLRVDHVEKYRLPKHLQEKEDPQQQYTGPGRAYDGRELANQYSLQQGQDLFAPPAAEVHAVDDRDVIKEQWRQERKRLREAKEAKRKEKKQKKAHKEEKRRRNRARGSRDDDSPRMKQHSHSI